jgi:hypothetical protein
MMEKKYIKPITKFQAIDSEEMLAGSLQSEGSVPPVDNKYDPSVPQLGKENSWTEQKDIWED